MCIWTTAEPRVSLLQRKTDLSPQLFITDRSKSVVIYSNCQCLSAFYFSLTYCLIYLG